MGSLRVIAGKARGRMLRTVPGDTTRPITDRTKESLFNIIGADIKEANFFDLFGGTGSVGIEALSRGADFVRFLDISRQAVDTIRFNLLHTQLADQAEVSRADTLTMLRGKADRRFEYIYVAPPQYKELWKVTLKTLDKNTDWLAEDGWIIVQIHPVEYESLILSHFIEFDQRKYGSTLLIFFQRKEPPE